MGSEGPDGVMGVCHRNTWRGCTVVKLALCEHVCSCACGGGGEWCLGERKTRLDRWSEAGRVTACARQRGRENEEG